MTFLLDDDSREVEGLPGDALTERQMMLGSLNLLRAVERAQGKYRPQPQATAVPSRPKPFPSLCAHFFVPGEMLGARIVRITAEAYGYTVPEMRSKGRNRRLVCARIVAARLLRNATQSDGSHRFSTVQIARLIGRGDHSTVVYLLGMFGPYRRAYPEMKAIYNLLRRRLA